MSCLRPCPAGPGIAIVLALCWESRFSSLWIAEEMRASINWTGEFCFVPWLIKPQGELEKVVIWNIFWNVHQHQNMCRIVYCTQMHIMPHFSHECWCVPCSMHECDWYWKVLSASWLVLCLALLSPLRTFWTSFPPVRSGFRPSLCSCWPLSWIGFVVLGYVAKNCECACPGPLEKWTSASRYIYMYIIIQIYTDIYRYIHTFFLWQQ